ncbi:hypothetical protein [Aquibium oceanicum]|uniref:Uncharacterized protein n=1 Tax=Aquibium oceanicum TaxID=1670800 RepID=A0A1L3SNG2_9HYPH|nr:hypothetical protein [Aquibium oceanicum]APH70946.1 hypothetical protein BSQ44_05800 [Aquibium oceanicum]
MGEKVFLTVRPAERDEVFTDMVRIHRSHRIDSDNNIIPAGKVIRIDHAGKHAFAIARGLPDTIARYPEKDRVILMDEFMRQRLSVSSGDKIDRRGITSASQLERILWYLQATNPAVHVPAWLAVISIGLGVLSILLSLALASSSAQESFDIDFSEVPTVHFPTGDQIVSAYPAFEDYSFMLFDICDAFDFTIDSGDCLIYPMNASIGGNALATVVDGNKVIVYDRALSPLVGYEGAEMIIAHELGHHHCRHLGRSVDPRHELQADAFAGAAAKLMRRSLEAALSAVSVLDERPSRTHPGRQDRVAAITAGWNDPGAGKACELP